MEIDTIYFKQYATLVLMTTSFPLFHSVCSISFGDRDIWNAFSCFLGKLCEGTIQASLTGVCTNASCPVVYVLERKCVLGGGSQVITLIKAIPGSPQSPDYPTVMPIQLTLTLGL